MGKLAEWRKENSPYLRLSDGESFTGTYKGFRLVPNRFDIEKQVVRYIFDSNGNEKTWDNGSGRLADIFDKIKEGSVVTITRHGADKNTKYEVTVRGQGQDENVPF